MPTDSHKDAYRATELPDVQQAAVLADVVRGLVWVVRGMSQMRRAMGRRRAAGAAILPGVEKR